VHYQLFNGEPTFKTNFQSRKIELGLIEGQVIDEAAVACSLNGEWQRESQFMQGPPVSRVLMASQDTTRGTNMCIRFEKSFSTSLGYFSESKVRNF
jgi:hypothetical protein